MLIHKVKNGRPTIPNEEPLQEITILAPARCEATSGKKAKKVTPHGDEIEFISSSSKATTKQKKSVLGKTKYGPGSGPQWKAGGTCYLNLHKAPLLQEPLKL